MRTVPMGSEKHEVGLLVLDVRDLEAAAAEVHQERVLAQHHLAAHGHGDQARLLGAVDGAEREAGLVADAVDEHAPVLGAARRCRDHRAVVLDVGLVHGVGEHAHGLDGLVDDQRVQAARLEHRVPQAHRDALAAEGADPLRVRGLRDLEAHGVGTHVDGSEERHVARSIAQLFVVVVRRRPNHRRHRHRHRRPGRPAWRGRLGGWPGTSCRTRRRPCGCRGPC
jgi:hypothetical protein